MNVGGQKSQIFLFYSVIVIAVLYVLYRKFFSFCSAANSYLHEQLMNIQSQRG